VAGRFGEDVGRIAEWLGVDSLAYLSVEGLMEAVRSTSQQARGFCNACFSGKYPVPVEDGVTKDENEW
jgi:amidophosphoribosyltransferase